MRAIPRSLDQRVWPQEGRLIFRGARCAAGRRRHRRWSRGKLAGAADGDGGGLAVERDLDGGGRGGGRPVRHVGPDQQDHAEREKAKVWIGSIQGGLPADHHLRKCPKVPEVPFFFQFFFCSVFSTRKSNLVYTRLAYSVDLNERRSKIGYKSEKNPKKNMKKNFDRL